MRKLLVLFAALCVSAAAAAEAPWRSLPLIANGKVDPNWIHIGYGGWAIEDASIRTDPDAKGLGLLVYKKEKIGNCQVRLVFKTKDARSNSGFYIRIDDGILDQITQPGAAFERDASVKPTEESSKKVMASAEREEGPWFAVHRGFEVQIAGTGDSRHGTGSIYSLAASNGSSVAPHGTWRTMIVTLDGDRVFVDLDGKRVTSFDSSAKDLPPQKIYHEPKRGPKRPQVGYIGLQTHDPGDIVWFKEISVRPLPSAAAK